MFKKLVIGALVTGIALTGGIGVTSADVTDNPVCNESYYVGNDGKYNWYYKGKINGMGWYQGRLAK
ncbi:hypothetical protein [Bacillus thuringiensis]|uniref:hypothetical protein n=1 Tax=Bacillus thuringiensis TaxID=1428 RepID=UPI000BFBD991|nr:hypothetical protein [Bacillus thuringiensis]PGP29859.1 hypothetical protein CN987_12275 [Bacillus thuringiensis]